MQAYHVLLLSPGPYTVVPEQLVHAGQPVVVIAAVVVAPFVWKTDDDGHFCQKLSEVKR